MTNSTNWPNPERPGVPMFHERDGWHWLSNRPNDAPFPAEWSHEDYCDAETEWFWDMGEEREDAHEMKGLYYHGPCQLPCAEDEATRIALNNIRTLTEQARKNIAVTSGARKMAKAIFPILAEIDRQVNAVRIAIPCLAPMQIAELLAGERERYAQESLHIGESWNCTELSPRNTARHIAQAIRNLGAAP